MHSTNDLEVSMQPAASTPIARQQLNKVVSSIAHGVAGATFLGLTIIGFPILSSGLIFLIESEYFRFLGHWFDHFFSV